MWKIIIMVWLHRAECVLLIIQRVQDGNNQAALMRIKRHVFLLCIYSLVSCMKVNISLLPSIHRKTLRHLMS